MTEKEHRFNIQAGKLIERPEWMSETRCRRLFKPVARAINLFKYEPLRDGYWPHGDPAAHSGTVSEYTGRGDRGMGGVLARIEINQEEGREPGRGLPKNPLQPRT